MALVIGGGTSSPTDGYVPPTGQMRCVKFLDDGT
jgi:hypothetical protein